MGKEERNEQNRRHNVPLKDDDIKLDHLEGTSQGDDTHLEKNSTLEPSVNTSSNPHPTRPQFNEKSNQLPNIRKRNKNSRKKKSDVLKVNNTDDGCQEVMPLTKTVPLGSDLCTVSPGDINTQTDSERAQLSESSHLQKRGRKKQKKMLEALKSNDESGNLPKGTSLLKISSENNDKDCILQEGSRVPSLNAENKDFQKEDAIFGSDCPTNMSENFSPSEKKSKKNRKQKKMDNAFERNDKSDNLKEGVLIKNILLEEDSYLPREKNKGKDQNMMHNSLKNNDMDHILEEAQRMPCSGAVTVKTSDKEDVISVSEAPQLDTTNIKDERNCSSPMSSNTTARKKQVDHADIDLVSQEGNIRKYRRKNKVETYYSESTKSSDSIGYCLEPIKEVGVRGTYVNCVNEAHVPTFSKNRLKKIPVRDHVPSMRVTRDISMEEASVICSDGEPVADEIKKGVKMMNLEETLLDFQDEHAEQKNEGGLNKTQGTSSDPSCEHLDRKNAETKARTEEMMISLSNLGVVKDNVVEDVIEKRDNTPHISLSLPENALIGCSKKKLLILDVNGLLADIVSDIPYAHLKYKPDIMISKKAVYKRPFVDEFLQFCFERFAVGVWSSRTKRNVDTVVDFLLGDSTYKLLFCWDQSHCTTTGVGTIENRNKPLVLKELKKLWEKLEPNLPWEKGEYNESNTLLLDDSPYKALRNPAHTAIFPNTYQVRDSKDNSLGPGGDLRVYLEGLAVADNVQKYVQKNPFGQRAITESNPSWRFYSRIIGTDSDQNGGGLSTSIAKQSEVS